jgi:hypothetical protein
MYTVSFVSLGDTAARVGRVTLYASCRNALLLIMVSSMCRHSFDTGT